MKKIKNRWKQAYKPPLRLFFVALAIKLGAWLLVKPLINLIWSLALRTTGYQLTFNAMILDFFLTPQGFVAALFILALAAAVIYVEFATLIYLSAYSIRNEQAGTLFALKQAAGSAGRLRHWSTVGFCIYVLGLLPLTGFGLSSSLLPQVSIPNFITGELTKNPWGTYLLAAAALLVLCLFFVTLFILPAMVLGGHRFSGAAVFSFKILRYGGRRLIAAYALFLVTWALVLLVPGFIMNLIFGTDNPTFAAVFEIYGLSWQTGAIAAIWGVFSLVRLCIMPMLLYVVVERYMAVGGSAELPALSDGDKPKDPRKVLERLKSIRGPKPVRIAGGAVLLFVLVLGAVRLLSDPPGLHPPIVLSHRGSIYGVENTLESIQGAIDAKAAYVEVDVYLSADDIPVVVHDSNLNRLTGQNINVYELTAEELQAIELAQNGYTGQIPTLNEVAEYCKGRINLAVELKLHGQEKIDPIEKVMEVLQAREVLETCIFVSLEYELVEAINTRYPECVAGYCIFGNVGSLKPSVIRSMAVDFVVIEEYMVTADRMYQFRASWLPVYVWTVNDPASMQKYLEMGAIGLVTDYPDVAQSVIDAFLLSADAYYLDEAEWRD